MRLVGNDVDFLRFGKEERPPNSPLEEEIFPEEGNELLRVTGLAQGKETAACTPYEYEGLHEIKKGFIAGVERVVVISIPHLRAMASTCSKICRNAEECDRIILQRATRP
jgi:hypothetical protein